MGPLRLSLVVAARLGVAVLLGACAGPGRYVWYTELPPDVLATANDYFIGVGDVLNIRVLGHDDMAVRARVRGDGRIALPILGEVEARSKRPSDLQKEIESRLKEYIITPTVTLNVEETLPSTISILGEVAHPGVYTVGPNARLAEALALSGGVTEYASRDRIFLVRTQPRSLRIRFTYQALTRDERGAASFPLRGGDVIVVE